MNKFFDFFYLQGNMIFPPCFSDVITYDAFPLRRLNKFDISFSDGGKSDPVFR